jgi:hypothetical protein
MLSVRDVFEVRPEKAALIAVLIIDRPLCRPCLSDKAQVTIDEVESCLRGIETIIKLKHGIDRCWACRQTPEVFSMFRPD